MARVEFTKYQDRLNVSVVYSDFLEDYLEIPIDLVDLSLLKTNTEFAVIEALKKLPKLPHTENNIERIG